MPFPPTDLMGSEEDSVLEHLRKYPSKGVVGDFVDLDLEKHSYECIYRHTDNLLKKTKMVLPMVDSIVRQGVFRALVAILKHDDQRQLAKLQHTAAVILSLILEASPQVEYVETLTELEVAQASLNLLRLRLDGLSLDVLRVLTFMQDTRPPNPFNSVPGSIAVLMDTATSETLQVKRLAVKIIVDLLEEKLRWNEMEVSELDGYFPRFQHLLGDSDAEVATRASMIYNAALHFASHEQAMTLVSPGLLTLFKCLLQKGLIDETFEVCAVYLVQSLMSFAKLGARAVEMLVQNGVVDSLSAYKNHKISGITLDWMSAYIICHGGVDVTAAMIEKKMIPSLGNIRLEGTDEERNITEQLLKRLMRNGTFLLEYLDSFLLDYFHFLKNVAKFEELKELLEFFKAALSETIDQGGQLSIRAAMSKKGRIKKVVGLGQCPGINRLVHEVLALCT